MAATSQPAPLAGDSFLERLPSELLEKILLEVVGDIIPPAGYRHNDAKPIRCELEGEFGASFASLLLGHRLVSRTIRSISWGSLAKVLGETLFDMCSEESMANLVALTRCASLAPWMNKLTMSCFKVNKTYPFIHDALANDGNDGCVVAYLNDVHQNDLRRLRDVDKIWYTTAWSLPTTTEDTSVLELGPVGINAEFERGLKYMVSACMVSLVNLDNICYYYDVDHIPARFRDFAHQHKSNDLFNFAVVSGVISEAGADLGFRLLMDMMLVAKLQPKCLCLAVTIKEPQYFVTSASSDAAMSIFRQVRELTLIEAGIVPRARSRPNPSISAIAVSRTNFPNLRSLSVELGWFPSSSPIHAILYPRILEVPGLRHISITRGNQMCPRLLNLFELYKGTLQSVSLRDMITVTYEPILKVLKSLSLEALTIHDEYGVWWEGDTYDEREFRGVPKGFLESVAKSGIFGPELLDEKLEDELEVELEEGLEE
ncbi:hypothetical protein HBI53_199530 [Parastagonospora nodorum]|nr:hypothetical protein HBI53_199530 [Parastagonospora nodorum]